MYKFASPATFQMLWLLLGLLLLWLVLDRAARGKVHKLMGARLTPFLTASLSARKRNIKRATQLLVLALAILALARPQSGESKQEVRSEGFELILLVDVSESMMAEDVRPNRLEQAKNEMSRLLDLMPGNKVGIVAFAGSASLLSPLTNDPNSLKLYLESLSPLSVSTQGTEFKRGLVEAKEAFKRGGLNSDTVRTTRVILVASDGEDHEQGALDEAQALAKDGIRIFSLAYGTEKGAPIPERDGNGFMRGYKKDQSGKTVLSQVKGDALKALAKAGQGSFYFAPFGGRHLEKLIEDFNTLEKTQYESEMATNYEERFQVILLAALILALIEVLLSERRNKFRLWQGRFEVPGE